MKKEKQMVKKIIIGFLAGLISGMFASGGGLILVPAFSYLLHLSEKQARATSVLCILPMVLTSGFFYFRSDFVDWRVGVLCAIGGMIGGAVGAKLLKKTKDQYLKLAFAIFLGYVSFKILFRIC